MKLFERESTRTRSKITRGVAPKAIRRGSPVTFMGKNKKEASKAWKEAGFTQVILTEEQERFGAPTSLENICPEVLLPGQLGGKSNSAPEYYFLEALFLQSIDRLRWTFKPIESTYVTAAQKKKEQEDLLAWYDGEEAAFPFEQTMEYLGSKPENMRRIIRFLCESWSASDGAIPDIDFNKSYNVPTSTREKPEPIFEGRCAHLKGMALEEE